MLVFGVVGRASTTLSYAVMLATLIILTHTHKFSSKPIAGHLFAKMKFSNKLCHGNGDDGVLVIYGLLFASSFTRACAKIAFCIYLVDALKCLWCTHTQRISTFNIIARPNKNVDWLQQQTKEKWKIIIVMWNVHWKFNSQNEMRSDVLTDRECAQIVCVAIHWVDIYIYQLFQSHWRSSNLNSAALHILNILVK